MYCEGNIGRCCSGRCETQTGAAFATCTAATTTTTTVTTTTTTTTTTATTTAGIIISIDTTTTTTTAAPSTSTCTTISGASGAGAQCVFPFTYMGVTYTGCPTAPFPQPWCSTQTDRYGNHVNGHWGDCNPSTCPMSASPATTAAPTSSCS